jgi:hypothetical protein
MNNTKSKNSSDLRFVLITVIMIVFIVVSCVYQDVKEHPVDTETVVTTVTTISEYTEDIATA